MPQINVSDETYKELQSLPRSASAISAFGDIAGRNWFIRTCTYHCVGYVNRIVTEGQLVFAVMSNCSWVADSGRFMQAIANGTLNEVEPVGDALVNLGSVIDMFPWTHSLPKDQK